MRSGRKQRLATPTPGEGLSRRWLVLSLAIHAVALGWIGLTAARVDPIQAASSECVVELSMDRPFALEEEELWELEEPFSTVDPLEFPSSPVPIELDEPDEEPWDQDEILEQGLLPSEAEKNVLPHAPGLPLDAFRRTGFVRRTRTTGESTPPAEAPRRSHTSGLAPTQSLPSPARLAPTPIANREQPLRVVFAPNPSRYYPRDARRSGLQGTTVVKITIDVRGFVTRAVVQRSSGSRLLDDAAVALARAYRFSTGIRLRHTRLPVVFRIDSRSQSGRWR